MYYAYNESGGEDLGPYTLQEIRAKIDSGEFPALILIRSDKSPSSWKPAHRVLGLSLGDPPPARPTEFIRPPVKPGTPLALAILGSIAVAGSILGGFVVGAQTNLESGLFVFLNGFVGGLLLLGVADIINYTFECAKTLHDIKSIVRSRNAK